MGLDDATTIDIVLGPTHLGKVTLVVTDGVPHADQAARFNKLTRKLASYVSYVFTPQFAAAHPGVGPTEVAICIVCHDPPNEVMKQMQFVRPSADDDPEHQIRVICVEYRPGMPVPDIFARPSQVR